MDKLPVAPGTHKPPILWCHPYKLGRKAVVRDSRTLAALRYAKSLPVPPASVDWSKGLDAWGMMLNDKLGCCAIAGVGHAVQTWTQANGRIFTIPDSEILRNYEMLGGYDPSKPETDEGCILLNVLKSWKNLGVSGHRLDAFGYVNRHNHDEVEAAINLFGALYIGFQVPSNLDETPGATWSTQGASDVEGGHCVILVGYDAQTVTVVSWGRIYKMTWDFFGEFVDEVYAPLSFDWISGAVSPGGFDKAALESDLASL